MIETVVRLSHYRQNAHAFLALVALGVLARGQAIFFPLLSIDTYAATMGSSPLEAFDFLIQQGRYGTFVLWSLRDLFGFWGPSATSMSMILSVPLLAASGLVFAYSIKHNISSRSALFFASIYSLHPFVTEFYYFSDATFNIVLSISIASVGMFFALRAERRVLNSILAFAALTISLSIYQLVVAHIGTVWLLALVSRCLDKRAWSWAVVNTQLKSLSVMAISLLAYLALAKVIAYSSGVNLDGRTSFTELADLHGKFDAIRKALQLTYLPPEGLVPSLASYLLLVMLSCSAAYLIFIAARRCGPPATLLVVGCLMLGLIWSASATAVGNIVWLVPRVLSPASVFIAGVIALTMEHCCKAYRNVLIASASAMVICYLGASNAILFDQRRVNLWDAQQANRIVARLEGQKGFHEIKKLAIVGGQWSRSVTLPTTYGDMNVSAFAVGWAKLELISYATGYRFGQPSADDLTIADKECRTREMWPAAESVLKAGELAIVCLTRPD